jgi:hypothetical protein
MHALPELGLTILKNPNPSKLYFQHPHCPPSLMMIVADVIFFFHYQSSACMVGAGIIT